MAPIHCRESEASIVVRDDLDGIPLGTSEQLAPEFRSLASIRPAQAPRRISITDLLCVRRHHLPVCCAVLENHANLRVRRIDSASAICFALRKADFDESSFLPSAHNGPLIQHVVLRVNHQLRRQSGSRQLERRSKGGHYAL